MTPMMQQYLDMKEKYHDCILFFRLGDFYEMFFEDAKTASRELEIVLTGRNCGQEERAPMCGVPYHSADSYIAKLISKGYKVAICEQVEDPQLAKGLVRRDVVRIITPGTVIESALLVESKNNYIMSIYKEGECYGLSACDISTGDFYATQVVWGDTFSQVVNEVARFKPAEIVVPGDMGEDRAFCDAFREQMGIYISGIDEALFRKESAEQVLRELLKDTRKKDYDIWLHAAGALFSYLIDTRKTSLAHIKDIRVYQSGEFMVLDQTARKNLELTENLKDGKKQATLLWTIDRTKTPMGARTLRKWMEQPLMDTAQIDMRLDGVEEIKDLYMARMEVMELLDNISDLERLTSKVMMESVNPRELTAMKRTLARLPGIKEAARPFSSRISGQVGDGLDELADVHRLIDEAIEDDAPLSLKNGGIIRGGYDREVDRLRLAKTDGRKWIVELEVEERKKTGIKSLKISFNRVFGYYIEITRSHMDLVPETYVRKQTLSNSERYITEELKDMESTILGAEEKLTRLEHAIFEEIRGKIALQVDRLMRTAKALGVLDALCALAETAERNQYVRPVVNDGGVIDIRQGRHPVVEKNPDCREFIPNDIHIDNDQERTLVITGPNMAGKSTYMRQTAQIVLLAQMGSFVPCGSAVIGITDRIFTRIGASDDLAGGKSTFMMEMTEVADILKNATDRSLLILDEIGRGTSTYDGLSIAWAVIEYLISRKRCKTLFSTHYHELTELEDKVPGVMNYRITAEKKGKEIIFLRKVERGGADESYGIQVAGLAGVPEDIVIRAGEILAALESNDITKKRIKRNMGVEGQINIMQYNSKNKKEEDVLHYLRSGEFHDITPLQALNKLFELKDKLS